MENQHKDFLMKGISIMILSSVCTCTGQLMWKLSSGQNVLLFSALGFVFYALGALLMMIAFEFGELSILPPMLSFGFVLSIILGAAVLGEIVSVTKVLGVAFIVVGMFFLARSGIKESK